MNTEAGKRESYSFFDFPSVLHRKRVRLESRALERTLIELETTPGVTEWRRVDVPVPFYSEGQERETTLQLSVARAQAPRQLVQLVRGTAGAIEESAIAAAREYCDRTQYEHVVVPERRLPRSYWETQNRRAAHAWLLQAENWDTTKLEEAATDVLHCHALRFSQLANELNITPLQAKLVFLRCWLRGLFPWDIGAESVGQDLLVGGRSG